MDDRRRGFAAADWLVRTATPAWLRVGGLSDHSRTIADMRPMDSVNRLDDAMSVLAQSRDAAAQAWMDIFYKAGPGERDAARTAAGLALWDSGFLAIGTIVWDVEWTGRNLNVVRAVWNTIKPTIRDAAWTAAWAAAIKEAGHARGDGPWRRSMRAASESLQATSATLRQSAQEFRDGCR